MTEAYKLKKEKWKITRLEIYDMSTKKGMSYNEIARELNLTPSRIGQIVNAVDKQKHA